MRAMAKLLGHSLSTVSREIRRTRHSAQLRGARGIIHAFENGVTQRSAALDDPSAHSVLLPVETSRLAKGSDAPRAAAEELAALEKLAMCKRLCWNVGAPLGV